MFIIDFSGVRKRKIKNGEDGINEPGNNIKVKKMLFLM